jgi:hypothetical protein
MKNRELRIIVTGGPDFDDREKLNGAVMSIVNAYKPFHYDVVLVTGGTSFGADAMARDLAFEHGFGYEPIHTRKSEGKAAMFRRNHRIVQYAGAAKATGGAFAGVVFWHPHHAPSKHLIQAAANEGIRIAAIEYQPNPTHLRKDNLPWVDEMDAFDYDCAADLA